MFYFTFYFTCNRSFTTEVGQTTSPTSTSDSALSGNVSWWAESVSLALGDLATRALGHDQLQQLYDTSVCMTSLAPDDVNISQHVLAAAAMFGQFILTNNERKIAIAIVLEARQRSR